MGKVSLVVAAAALLCVISMMLFLVIVGSDDDQGPGQGSAGVVCAPADGGPSPAPPPGLNPEQMANAAGIVAAGDELGVPQRAKVIAVAAAMQESGLRVYANSGDPASLALPHEAVGSDHDSVGLFQQRASWGSAKVRMDPKASAKLFYGRLLAVPGWQSLPLTAAAQRVQVSATPDAYAKWEAKADQIVGAVLGIVCQPATPPPGGATAPANPLAQQVIDRALSQLGVPYAWGGGNETGPTRGISGPDTAKIGFDCSGLMVYAFAGIGVTVPHQTMAIWKQFGPPITDKSQIQPGDMIMLSSSGSPSATDHVGLYLGNGRVVHAPESGTVVRTVDNIWANAYWSSHFVGALRPHPAPTTNPA